MRELTDCDFLNGGLGSVDYDKDGVLNCEDNCPLDSNPSQRDTDKNGIGDACEWREQQRQMWEQSGREQRRQAREPVDIAGLSVASTDIVLARFTDEGWIEGTPKKWLVVKVEVLRRFKDSTSAQYRQYQRPMWVAIPDGGPPELVGELLLFLKNDTAKNWKKPDEWPSKLRTDVAPEELKYFRYQLADPWYGVLGVSAERLVQIEKTIGGQEKKRD
ncbi:MAG TPA: thrombospondin type 3 repeat-containing protein [Blastocatellia bacterium]|nr:thrombospondin type 3 repeat-containing protein [Blastocatellia bacterium]